MNEYWLIKPDGSEVGIESFEIEACTSKEINSNGLFYELVSNGQTNFAVKTVDGEYVNTTTDGYNFWLDEYLCRNWEFDDFKIVSKAKR